MKSISESLVPLTTSKLTSATPVQEKSTLLNHGTFAEALVRVKDQVSSTGTEQRLTDGTNQR